MAKTKAANAEAVMPMAIKSPPDVGDTVTYIKDGNGVYHPVEDCSMTPLTSEQMTALMQGLTEEE